MKFKYNSDDVIAFVKQAEKDRHQRDVAILAPLVGPFSGLAAEKGRGWATAGGAMLGSIGGRAAGLGLGALTGNPVAKGVLARTGSLAGGSAGAYYAHGTVSKKRKKHRKSK